MLRGRQCSEGWCLEVGSVLRGGVEREAVF